MEVNKYWLCDEGRFNFHYVGDRHRVTSPQAGGQAAEWGAAIDSARAALKGAAKVAVLVGSDLTQEEGKLLLEAAPQAFPGASLYHFGTTGVKTAGDDADSDKLLKRKSKTSNLHGLEKLGYKPFDGSKAGAYVVVRGGRAQMPDFGGAKAVGLGVFTTPQAAKFVAVLPGAAFAEKDGTVVNFQGREQRLKRAVVPPGQSKQLSEIL
jgi:NADH-quinone oxidoreductase subunit G